MRPKRDLLARKAPAAYETLRNCSLCPRHCGIDRTKGERGFCGAGNHPVLYRYLLHPGEEPPISGTRGSGVIFFSYCVMRCLYCQNYRFSQLHEGSIVTVEDIARVCLELQEKGAHNVNLVSATQFLPFVLDGLSQAVARGFSLPIVYNTSGFESRKTLRLLEGVVDIYLADMRSLCERYSGAPDYSVINRRAVGEMFRQVGTLEIRDGVALRGLIIRHLVLPGAVDQTGEILRFISEELSREVAVSLMSQYTPFYRAPGDALLGRRITAEEYTQARALLEEYRLENGWVQDLLPDPSLAGPEL